MAKYGNENAAAGGRSRDTAGRDRSYGGGGLGGGGGSGAGGDRTASVIGARFGAPSATAQVAAARRNAPTNAPYAGQGGLNARRTVNPTPSYEMSLHNMMELAKMMPGVGMPARMAMTIAGYGPEFQGSTGTVNGTGDYDPSNRFGLGLLTRMNQRRGLQRMY